MKCLFKFVFNGYLKDLKSGGEVIKKVEKFTYLGSITVNSKNTNSKKGKIYIWKFETSVNNFKNIKVNKNEHNKDKAISMIRGKSPRSDEM